MILPVSTLRRDPYLSFNYIVEINNITVGGFSEISGIEVETEIEEYREGGVNEYVHKLPKTIKYPNLVLRRGIVDVDELYLWYKSIIEDILAGKKVEGKNVFISMIDENREPARVWTFSKAYPVKWTGPELRANSSTVAVESLELAHKGIVWL